MNRYLSTTQSTCRDCGRLIPAQVWARADGVWFEKRCPEHGPQQARVWSDAEGYLKLRRFYRAATMPASFATRYQGCPDSCGLCPEHEQHVCLPILEITDHCDLRCPICLVSNRATYHHTRQTIGPILDGLIRSERQIDVLNLSGGEPTTNPHFRDIIEECTARKEILRVSVSTNGLTLNQRPELLEFLASRHVIVSLQFDGELDSVDETLRGRSLRQSRLDLIEACRRLDLSMSLTATIARGVNDHLVPSIVRWLFEQPHVVSVMFQPAAYAGHAAALARPRDAVTLPDVIAQLDGAADGTISAGDFSPLPCSHPACFALAFYLHLGDGRFTSVKRLLDPLRYLDLIQNRGLFGTDAEAFHHVTDALSELWASPEGTSPAARGAMSTIKRLLNSVTAGGGYDPGRAFQLAEREIKSVFIHQFMDRHTFDLSRARKCCQVYPQADGRLIPACVFNCLKRPRAGHGSFQS